MSERKISYLDRTFEDYRASLKEYILKYYPQIASDFNDAAIGSWLIDMVASVADNLSFYIDKAYSETNLDTAQNASSVFSLARSNGLKVPGPKGAVTLEHFSVDVPVSEDSNTSRNPEPNTNFTPIIRKGTLLSNGNQVFEVMSDIDFAEDMNDHGEPNRDLTPITNANGDPIYYRITKKEVIRAGRSKIYKQVLTSNMVTPFMEFVIPDTDVMNIESIIFKDGSSYQETPDMSDFMMQSEYLSPTESRDGKETYRFFEVDSLTDHYRWGDDVDITAEGNQAQPQPKKVTYGYERNIGSGVTVSIPTAYVAKGKWVPLTQKFITEFTDKGYLKITFGSGEEAGQTLSDTYDNQTNFSEYQISKMIRNNFLGKLPPAGWTMFILYRVGGGSSTNVPANTITNFENLQMDIKACTLTESDKAIVANIRNSLKATNVIPSVSGKDAPTVDEIRAMIKYNNGAQKRCVTLNDYKDRILQMPAKYGSPFRLSTLEANNKVMIYLLGLDNNGRLSDVIPATLVENIENYLSMFRTINDYVEIKKGRIVNLSFEVEVHINKNYTAANVISEVMSTIKDYMDINKHQLGEDIYIGDLEKEISKIDGILNLVDLRVYNEYGSDYSSTITSMPTFQLTHLDSCSADDINSDATKNRVRIDLDESEYILKSERDEMFEIKYPDKNDIKVYAKVR